MSRARNIATMMQQTLQQMREMAQRNSYIRPSPRRYGEDRSRYFPHVGKKELAKAARRAAA